MPSVVNHNGRFIAWSKPLKCQMCASCPIVLWLISHEFADAGMLIQFGQVGPFYPSASLAAESHFWKEWSSLMLPQCGLSCLTRLLNCLMAAALTMGLIMRLCRVVMNHNHQVPRLMVLPMLWRTLELLLEFAVRSAAKALRRWDVNNCLRLFCDSDSSLSMCFKRTSERVLKVDIRTNNAKLITSQAELITHQCIVVHV